MTQAWWRGGGSAGWEGPLHSPPAVVRGGRAASWRSDWHVTLANCRTARSCDSRDMLASSSSSASSECRCASLALPLLSLTRPGDTSCSHSPKTTLTQQVDKNRHRGKMCSGEGMQAGPPVGSSHRIPCPVPTGTQPAPTLWPVPTTPQPPSLGTQVSPWGIGVTHTWTWVPACPSLCGPD